MYVSGAPANKHVVVFVDDLNMPKLDSYGSQPPIELLRQFQDFKGFYDRDKFFWKEIQVQYLHVSLMLMLIHCFRAVVCTLRRLNTEISYDLVIVLSQFSFEFRSESSLFAFHAHKRGGKQGHAQKTPCTHLHIDK